MMVANDVDTTLNLGATPFLDSHLPAKKRGMCCVGFDCVHDSKSDQLRCYFHVLIRPFPN
jgi:hypothetical protein